MDLLEKELENSMDLEYERKEWDYLPILLANPQYIPQSKKFIPDRIFKYLEVVYKVFKKERKTITQETLLPIIKDQKVADEFKRAFSVSSESISVLLEWIKHEQQEEFRSALFELEAKGDISLESIKNLYDKIVVVRENIVETEFQVNSVNDLFEIWNKIEEDSSIAFIPSGFNCINNKIEGGYKQGSTICWLGPSGSGKTLWLCNEAARIWHDGEKSVLYISTEMNEKAIYSRILKSAFNKTKDTINETFVSIKTNGQYPWKQIKVIKVHPNDISCEDIQRKIEELEFKPDVIIIDYFDEIRASEKTASEYDKHGIVASDMKKLAEINECPILTATQANRGALDEKGGSKEIISAANIGDSYKKVRTLDLLLCIIQTGSQKSANQYELLIDKNRYGPSNIKAGSFSIDWSTMKIEEISSNSTSTTADKALDILEDRQRREHLDKLDEYYTNIRDLSREDWTSELKTLVKSKKITLDDMKEIVLKIKKYKGV